MPVAFRFCLTQPGRAAEVARMSFSSARTSRNVRPMLQRSSRAFPMVRPVAGHHPALVCMPGCHGKPPPQRRFRRRRRNLDFEFCGERQPRQPRSPHSLSSSPLCHSRVFVTSFVTSTFHCRNVAPPFAERGARRNNLPPCLPHTIHQNLNNVNFELPAFEAPGPPGLEGPPEARNKYQRRSSRPT